MSGLAELFICHPGGAMKLKDIHARHLVLPLNTPIRTAIHQIEDIHVLLTEVEDDAGNAGFGAAIAFRPEFIQSMLAILRDVAPLVREQRHQHIPAVREAMLQRINYIGLSGVAVQAIATVDMALWVLMAERLQQPLFELLGACTDRLDAYHGHGLWIGTTGQALADEARSYVDQGYRAIKLRLGLNDLGADLDRVERVRKAIGSTTVLMVDTNQGQQPMYAQRLGAALEPYDIFWYEEPVAYTDVETHARLAAQLKVPIATGQSEYLERGMLNYLRAQACQVIMPDVCRMGGITGWKKATALAEAFQTPVSNHLYVEFGQHLQASIPNRTYADTIDWLNPLFDRPIRFEDGMIVLPDAPGIGLRLDQKAIDRFQSHGH
jgi:L-alanine-DL-glutamate epimerase-like enolase superfamily enzyme